MSFIRALNFFVSSETCTFHYLLMACLHFSSPDCQKSYKVTRANNTRISPLYRLSLSICAESYLPLRAGLVVDYHCGTGRIGFRVGREIPHRGRSVTNGQQEGFLHGSVRRLTSGTPHLFLLRCVIIRPASLYALDWKREAVGNQLTLVNIRQALLLICISNMCFVEYRVAFTYLLRKDRANNTFDWKLRSVRKCKE